MIDILTGKTKKHLTLDTQSGFFIHNEMLSSLDKIREAAAKAGFQLAMTSAFRSFEDQLKIWNAKARGERILYNDKSVPLNYDNLTKKEILYAILRWSALPGASRHHWGSDFDVYDKNSIVDNYIVQLLPEETEIDGIFGEFHAWLDKNLLQYNFFRPYAFDTGGIAPERWHLSYSPVSSHYQSLLSYELIEETIKDCDIELKELILEELPDIYQRFINIKN